MKIYEEYIGNNPEEKQKLEAFYSDYENLKFTLVPIQNRIRKEDVLVGEYSSDGEVDINVEFFENDEGGWTIKAVGTDTSESNTLDVSFDYANFIEAFDILTKDFLNIKDGDPLLVWLGKTEFSIIKAIK